MNFVSRSQWGALSPTANRNVINAKPDGCAIHWEGPAMGDRPHSECATIVKGIQHFHIYTRGWSDIAYSLIVCEHGYVFEGRGKGVGSAANGTTVSNGKYYAICAMVGKGDAQPPALIQGIKDAVALCRSWGAGNAIVGHRDLFNTDCPGDALYAMVRNGTFGNGGIINAVKRVVVKTANTVSGNVLRIGSRGVAVANLQKGLNKVFPAYSHLATDGIYGEQTKTVVMNFQRRAGLSADGEVGIMTRAALKRYGIVL